MDPGTISGVISRNVQYLKGDGFIPTADELDFGNLLYRA